MTQKSATITGITGQDGSYLAAWLLSQGYLVRGWHRPERLRPERLERLGILGQVELVPVVLADAQAVAREICLHPTAEFYHLAACSSLAEGQDQPLLIAQEDGLNCVRILEGIRLESPSTRFLAASSAEVFGFAEHSPQNEQTPHNPVNPYGCCKSFSQNMTAYYRDRFNLLACSAILYNHESPLRDTRFVTQKIVNGLLKLRSGCDAPLILGNLQSQRDWGSAQEYAQVMWRMLQLDRPQDLVVATGKATTVRSFVEMCADELGFQIEWRCCGDSERGYDLLSGQLLVEVSPQLKRRKEPVRLGDASKAAEVLNWKAQMDVRSLVAWMVGEASKRSL